MTRRVLSCLNGRSAKPFFMAFTRAQWLLEDTTAYRSCAEEFKKIIESDEDDDLLLLDEKI